MCLVAPCWAACRAVSTGKWRAQDRCVRHRSGRRRRPIGGRSRAPRPYHAGVRDDERTKRALVFGEVAELYDRARPSYPERLVADVVAEIPDAPRARVLEVGAGTGK